MIFRAADLVQQVLLAVLEALRAGRLQNDEKLPNYVLGTARMIVHDMRRAEGKQRAIAAELGHEVVVVEPRPRLDERRLFPCLSQLPAREARVLLMSFQEERNAGEIAAQLALSGKRARDPSSCARAAQGLHGGSMSCQTPIALDALVAWWLGELTPSDEEQLEEHLFCLVDACAAQSARHVSLILSVRDSWPPVVTRSFLDALDARGVRVRITDVTPDKHFKVHFAADVDVLVHHLRADLRDADRVDLHVATSAGDELAAFPEYLPFDAEQGVLVPCQRHYVEIMPGSRRPVSPVRVVGWPTPRNRRVPRSSHSLVTSGRLDADVMPSMRHRNAIGAVRRSRRRGHHL